MKLFSKTVIAALAAAAAIASASDLSFASAHSDPLEEQICRVVITGSGVNLCTGPVGDAATKASSPAEYIASRNKIVVAGTQADGAEWYELIGVMANDNDSLFIDPLDGKEVGSLFTRSLFVSAKFAREIPSRYGDAEAVRATLGRRASNMTPDSEEEKFIAALEQHVGASILDAAARHPGARVVRFVDTDSPAWSESIFTTMDADRMYASWLDDWMLQCGIAQEGAEIGGLVIGSSTRDDVVKLFGGDAESYPVEKRGFDIEELVLTGGADVYSRSRSGGAPRLTIAFDASTCMSRTLGGGEGGGMNIAFFFDASGKLTAIEKTSFGWN